MKFNIPKVFGQVHFGDYAPALKGEILLVWLNMPREKREALDVITPNYKREMGELAEKRVEAQHKFDVLKESMDAPPSDNVARITPAGLEQLQIGLEAKKAELDKQASEALRLFNRSLLTWWAEIWSQGDDAGKHWTVEELEEVDRADPDLLRFMLAQSNALINDHRARAKKA